MLENEFREHLQERKLKVEDIDFTVSAVREFEKHLSKSNKSIESAGLDALIDYISLLINEEKNSWDRLVAIARYCNYAKKNDYYIYFASILGARNVLPDIGERVASIAGEKTRRRIFQDFERLQKDLWEKEAEKRQMEKKRESLIQEKSLRQETLVRLDREKDLLDAKQAHGKRTLQNLHSRLVQFESDLSTREKKLKNIEAEKVRSQRQLHGIKQQLERKKKDITNLVN